MHREVLDRAGIDAEPAARPGHLPARHRRAQALRGPHAPTSPSRPALHAGAREARAAAAPTCRRSTPRPCPPFVATPVVQYGALAAGVVVAPAWGAAALAAFLRPALPRLRRHAGPPAGPHARRRRSTARLGASCAPLRTARGGWQPPASPRRSGPARTGEPPRPPSRRPRSTGSCSPTASTTSSSPGATPARCASRPTCRRASHVGDLLQFKPGEFELDECGGCGHVFQNPRLSLEGLDFYYRDFYDGMGGEQLEFVFSSDDTSYRGRADLVARHAPTTPKRWLDVGGGHGHFCLVAAGVLPDTTFDGLDLGDGIVEAERRRWIDRSLRRACSPTSPRTCRAPTTWSRCTTTSSTPATRPPSSTPPATVLESGGHLLIEVPDPECRYGRAARLDVGPVVPAPAPALRVGRQPHLACSADRGFIGRRRRAGPGPPARRPRLRPDAVHQPHRRPPGQALDRARPRPLARLRRAACFTVLAPVMVGALFLDRAIAPARQPPRLRQHLPPARPQGLSRAGRSVARGVGRAARAHARRGCCAAPRRCRRRW